MKNKNIANIFTSFSQNFPYPNSMSTTRWWPDDIISEHLEEQCYGILLKYQQYKFVLTILSAF